MQNVEENQVKILHFKDQNVPFTKTVNRDYQRFGEAHREKSLVYTGCKPPVEVRAQDSEEEKN